MKEKLLNLLKDNARLSNLELARMLKSTETDVTAMIKDLEEAEILLKYTAVVNDELVDKNGEVTAFIEIRVTPERDKGFDSIGDRLQHFPEVQSIYLMSGAYDLLVVVKGATLKEIASFVSSKLSPLGRVLSTSTHFLLKKYKENGVVMGHKDPGNHRLNVAF